MTRRAIVFDERRMRLSMLAPAILLASLGGLVYLALRSAPEVEPIEPYALPGIEALSSSRTLTEAPLPMSAAPEVTPMVAPTLPRRTMPTQPADLPYRFVGKSVNGSKTSIVMFGRGRIVTLDGPGPLDADYTVEAVFDDFLVIRHAPTGTGRFLELVQRQNVVESPQDPENSPRD
jgi:hypothetical protein